MHQKYSRRKEFREALYEHLDSERRSRQRKPVVMVIGDGMQDVYWLAETPTRLSAEAPIPVYNVTSTKQFPGGAKNVVACLVALGVDVDAQVSSGPLKNRLMVGDTQVARFDSQDHCAPLLLETLDLQNTVAIIVSDYDKGSIDNITLAAINTAIDTGIPTYIDTKRSPSCYNPKAKFFPNNAEYWKYHTAYYNIPQTNIIRKLGPKGVLYNNVIYPSLATNIASVNGAGDAVIAAWCYADNIGIKAPDVFAMAAAAVACGEPYTYAPPIDEVLAIYNTRTEPVYYTYGKLTPKDEASKDASSEAREDTHE